MSLNKLVKNVAYWIPTKPYSIVDAINRMALATGSVERAITGADADYNGHTVVLKFNHYRKYYVGEYYWGERRVVARGGSFQLQLMICVNEYKRQGRGAKLMVYPHTIDDLDFIKTRLNKGLTKWSRAREEDYNATWKTWQYQYVNTAITLERKFAIPVMLLIEAKSYDEWQKKINARRKNWH